MVGETFTVEEVVRVVEARLGVGRKAGWEASSLADPLRRGFPGPVLTGNCFPCKLMLEVAERAELSGAGSFSVGLCSETGLAFLLASREEKRDLGERKQRLRE